jgi:hypothetical protein
MFRAKLHPDDEGPSKFLNTLLANKTGVSEREISSVAWEVLSLYRRL